MYCGNCGQNITDKVSFCPNCGERITAQPNQIVSAAPSTETAAPTGKKKKGKKRKTGKIVLTIFLIVFIFFVVSGAIMLIYNLLSGDEITDGIIPDALTTTSAESSEKIKNVNEYLDAMEKNIPIADRVIKDAESLKAADGYGFKYNGVAYEIYKFSDAEELKKAESGTYSFAISGAEDFFGDITAKTVVNGNFVLFIYDDFDSEVISAFKAINT